MIRTTAKKSDQKGATLVEFAIGASVFLLALFALIEFGRLLWTHNALNDAARRAARYAINQPASSPLAGVEANGTDVGPSVGAIKNVGVYGNPLGGSQPLVNNLSTANLHVHYTNFGLGEGTVAVTVTSYQFQFIMPFIGTTITMPDYESTISGENAGVPP